MVATSRLGNYCQIFKNAVVIPDTDASLSKAGRGKELAYQVMKIDLMAMPPMILPVTITIGDHPWHFAIDPSGQFLFTCDNGSNQISKIDTATDAVVATIPLSTAPRDAVTW